MSTRKPNMGLDFTPTHRSRDTAHAQPKNWRDPLASTAAKNVVTWYCAYLKNYKTNQDENLPQYWDHENVFFDAILWRYNKFKVADGRHIENRFFGHNSAADCPISLKFCMGKQNSMVLEITWHKRQILKIHNGRQPPFKKMLKRHIDDGLYKLMF